MIQDFKFAFRQLLKSPGFTAVAVLTLALAIGVNSAIFALINDVVLHPVVPERPNEVVNVFSARQNASHDYRQFSYNEYRELRENGGNVFADVAALEFAVAGIGRDHEMRRSFAFLTSENYFSLMGAKPYRGRFYSGEECKPNANIAVVVTSYGFWKRMGSRADFVGSTLQINGQPYTVIGIAADGFSGANALIAPDIWAPIGVRSQLGSAFGDSETMHDLMNPKNYAFNLTGRMRPGLTIDMAKSRLPVLAQRLTAIQPADSEAARELQIQTPSRFSLSTQPEDDGPITLIATLLTAMAGAVLLIACLNLANMLLARATSRSKEIAVRLAVGASRWRIVRQLLCEGFLLALCGGAIEGDRRPARRRRIAMAHREAIALRRFLACSLRRRDRPRAERLVQRSSASAAPQSARFNQFFVRRKITPRRGGALSHISVLLGCDHALQSWPGVKIDQGRSG